MSNKVIRLGAMPAEEECENWTDRDWAEAELVVTPFACVMAMLGTDYSPSELAVLEGISTLFPNAWSTALATLPRDVASPWRQPEFHRRVRDALRRERSSAVKDQ